MRRAWFDLGLSIGLAKNLHKEFLIVNKVCRYQQMKHGGKSLMVMLIQAVMKAWIWAWRRMRKLK